ncbi:transposable element p transposase [Plakobranchus ocellatus]|uniref:Transposable element p transposase n=1 Tax=Plakobranchus ocellatus TaxID=259542 RepID=A0AAV4D0X6_9GAST|nr:transposable element p transposase [Plakobranchus ocellatus]
MLRGLTKNWRQPISYFLSSGPTQVHVLQHLVIESIRQARALGLKPKIAIWDQGSNNRAVTQRLGVTSEDPYFFVDGEKSKYIQSPTKRKCNFSFLRRNLLSARDPPVDLNHPVQKQDGRIAMFRGVDTGNTMSPSAVA